MIRFEIATFPRPRAILQVLAQAMLNLAVADPVTLVLQHDRHHRWHHDHLREREQSFH